MRDNVDPLRFPNFSLLNFALICLVGKLIYSATPVAATHLYLKVSGIGERNTEEWCAASAVVRQHCHVNVSLSLSISATIRLAEDTWVIRLKGLPWPDRKRFINCVWWSEISCVHCMSKCAHEDKSISAKQNYIKKSQESAAALDRSQVSQIPQQKKGSSLSIAGKHSRHYPRESNGDASLKERHTLIKWRVQYMIQPCRLLDKGFFIQCVWQSNEQEDLQNCLEILQEPTSGPFKDYRRSREN